MPYERDRKKHTLCLVIKTLMLWCTSSTGQCLSTNSTQEGSQVNKSPYTQRRQLQTRKICSIAKI